MKKVLHLSYDLRRRKGRPVTTAVSDLIEETEKIADVKIIDLLRVPGFKEELVELKKEKHLLVNSFGLPFGIFLIYSLKRAYHKIVGANLEDVFNLSSIDIIHAHKVTFEGYIAYKLSIKYNTKLILTLRQTDAWIFRRRPDLIRHFKPVFMRSNKIIYLMPHITKLIEKYLGEPFFNQYVKNKLEFLPNIVERNIVHNQEVLQNGFYLTALRMNKRSVWRKNIKRLFKAIKLLNNSDIKLLVLGDGEGMQKVKKWVTQLGIDNNILFNGDVPNSEMDKYYSSSVAFLMPSLSESFGMVYAESLLNGTPIMYSKNRMGFDGIFENVGVGVDPSSVDSIAKGIEDLIRNNSFYRQHISNLLEEGEFKIFSADHVRNRYSEIINSLTNKT